MMTSAYLQALDVRIPRGHAHGIIGGLPGVQNGYRTVKRSGGENLRREERREGREEERGEKKKQALTALLI